MQVPRRIRLRRQHPISTLRRQRPDQRVIQHSCRMHNPGQLMLRRDGGQQVFQRAAIGDVTRGHADVRTQPG